MLRTTLNFSRILLRLFAAALFVLATAARAETCLELLARLDGEVARHQVADAQSTPVPGYPFLSANRFLASFAGPMESIEFDHWTRALAELDVSRRRVELSNLPPEARASFDSTTPEGLAACVETLRANLGESDHAALAGNVRVPDDYRTWQRVLGLYPLSVIPFHLGILGMERDMRELYASARTGPRTRYAPEPAAPLEANVLASALQELQRVPLAGLPASVTRALLAAHAPIFEVDVMTDDDRIGALEWTSADQLTVNLARPVVYTALTYTRFAGAVLPQMNYVIWFPSRPKTSATDLLGGHLDGITWRVTLGLDGQPLLADAIHNCGCYHQFFPSARLKPRERPASMEESAFIPHMLPNVLPGDRFRIRVASQTHYLYDVTAENASAAESLVYGMTDYDQLRSLDHPQGRRSAFGTDGIIKGTSRGERFLFWPMGIADPGAMRQMGRHATAFVGRRHFDDANLLDTYFEPATP